MSHDVPYSRLDRLIHRLAFHNAVLQDILPDLETRLLSARWQQAPTERPVFVTSLPRSGTTVLLEVLHRLPGLASHTYRDMPFILTPVLWNSVSSAFQRRGTTRERAHGDGLAVSEDSPEAFEEVLWKKFFADKYAGKRIELWTAADEHKPFTDYFVDHIRKVVSLRREGTQSAGRYLSKNNANVARIDLLRRMFPDASVLVPVRHPVEHALSMWRQHRNFLERHTADAFVREYMEDIGHFEFGLLHKPLAFDGFAEAALGLDPVSPDYWLAYWICAFEHLSELDGPVFIRFESLCAGGPAAVEKLAEELALAVDDAGIEAAAAVLRPAPEKRANEVTLPAGMESRALQLYAALGSRFLL